MLHFDHTSCNIFSHEDSIMIKASFRTSEVVAQYGIAGASILSICTILLLVFGWNMHLSLPSPLFDGLQNDLHFKLDFLAATMLAVVAVLGLVVVSYSKRYLLSDTTRPRFLIQLMLTIASVCFFILAGNLLTAFIGWQWIGLNLYLLLNHYHYQSEANRAAKKKFIINRIGDMSFLLAIVMCYHFYGTTEYQQLAMTNSVQIGFLGSTLSVHALILGFVFIAIMTKSAQFPFHIWLPDTMQTPTPVSALMHAGVINAGGIMLARLSPLFSQSTYLPYAMLLIGFVTLIIGSLFKQTQSDIKKQLAYSTMSQMGYMVMQSAVGCFSAAVFHLIAHGFYKAGLFLNAGNALFDNVNGLKNFHKATITKVAQSLILTLALIALAQYLMPHIFLGSLIWVFIAITLHQINLNILLQPISTTMKIYGLVFYEGILLAYIYLLDLFESFANLPSYELVSDHFQLGVGLVVILFYAATLFIPAKSLQQTTFGLRMYIFIKHKMYIEKLYRHCLLTPIRRIGDQLNSLILKEVKKRRIFIITSALLPVGLLITTYLNTEIPVLFTNGFMISALFMLLVMANRAQQLATIIQLIFISHMYLLSIVAINIGLSKISIAPNVIVQYLAVFGALWSLVATSNHPKTHLLLENKLTQWGCYVAVFMFLLIGLPGTMSFIAWFELINCLLMHPALIIMVLLCNVMLAIVVLHTLQDYVFNLQNSFELSIKNRWVTHSAFMLIIFSNLLSGVFL